ncbi:bifunctional 5,10-methylenetetrahydrofolate dehydrogenase/5,10-methenyltetrahydrofolate cyclohydrolase [Candidatus Saccharibacteria bacterium]|nr:bifunctional 5,10-methylenetetrahydrofolate dehydrogenase/5,10-methenyltetrahydrofolate cyclohydrolase [Candidatus Saccharibacteria bacterium]
MRILNGLELADYIKERQAHQVRNLRQAYATLPKLAIVQLLDDEVINTYVRMKQRYGEDILVEVEVVRPDISAVQQTIETLNNDTTVHGIIVQLPVGEPLDVTDVVNCVAITKDVDGLAEHSQFTPATAMAIDWLVNGYNIDMKSRKIAIVGNGRLVGAPLAKLWREHGYNVTVLDQNSKNVPGQLRRHTMIVSAAGVPGLITSDMLQPGAVVVDAATSAEHGKVVGDIAAEVRSRKDLTITPEKGGVGPLTVAALFDNVIRAARATVH